MVGSRLNYGYANHINHLNRALKTITGKTTTQLIMEHILEDSKVYSNIQT